MLTELVIENFKAFGERQVIPLAPITLIFGSNSAGKSSIIQSLLLMKQSNLGKDALVVRGEFVDLGSFKALIHRHDMQLPLTLGAAAAIGEFPQTYEDADPRTGRRSDGSNIYDGYRDAPLIGWGRTRPSGLTFEVVFGQGQAEPTGVVGRVSLNLSYQGQTIDLGPSTEKWRGTGVFGHSAGLEASEDYPGHPAGQYQSVEKVHSLTIADTQVLFSWAGSLAKTLDKDLTVDDFALSDLAEGILHISRKKRLPDEFIGFSDPVSGISSKPSVIKPSQRIFESDSLGADLEFESNRLKEFEETLENLLEAEPAEGADEDLLLHNACELLVSSLQVKDERATALLDRVSLISLYRQVIYGQSQVVSLAAEKLANLRSIGIAGKFVGNLLQNSHDSLDSAMRRLQYLGPLRDVPDRLSILTGERLSEVGIRGENLVGLLARSPGIVNQVNKWLLRLEIPYEIEVMGLGDTNVSVAIGDVHCLLLKDVRTGVSVSTSDVGFGISQILPVVVASLTMIGTLCIEQPEIHLHPGLQARLGDLFAQAYLDGAEKDESRQFILETHSEHLVLRMQRLIRRGTLKPEDVCVLHVGFDDGGRSVVKRLEIDSLGDFTTDWPGGFFDERLDEVFGD